MPSSYRIPPNRWGHIKRIRNYWAPRTEKRGAVTEVITHGTKMWKLRCDCGHEWDIVEDDFPGRRELRSCGRPECEFTPKPKVWMLNEERKAVFSVYLPIPVADYIRQYGQGKNLSFSRSLTDLVYHYQALKLINDE